MSPDPKAHPDHPGAGEGGDPLAQDLEYVMLEVGMLADLRSAIPFGERPPMRRSILDTLHRILMAQEDCLTWLQKIPSSDGTSTSDPSRQGGPSEARRQEGQRQEEPRRPEWFDRHEAWDPLVPQEQEMDLDEIIAQFRHGRLSLIDQLVSGAIAPESPQMALVGRLSEVERLELTSLKHQMFDRRAESVQQRLMRDSGPAH